MFDPSLQALPLPFETDIPRNVDKLVRRREVDSIVRDAKEIERRRSGAIAMAVIAILLLTHRRVDYDSLVVLAIELAVGLLCLALARQIVKRAVDERFANNTGTVQPANWSVWVPLCVIAAIAVPWIANPIAKQFGNGNGMEIVMLSSLGWGSFAMALLSIHLRSLSLSVVCSGFLTLFATFISDSRFVLWFPLAWGLVCLWWLVNNYWEQVETTAAVGIRHSRVHRVVFTLAGCGVFLAGAFVVSDRIPVLRSLKTEWMPTSGGTGEKDSAARRGVGNGDALIAAKKHATSFGAVETDMFLESEKSSLFDAFTEEYGEPKKKLKRTERAQALSPENLTSEDGKFTEANRAASSSEFSIERELPEERKPVDDLVAESLMFWQGESAAHLAVQRFEHFDGAVWSNADTKPVALENAIERETIGKQSWFFPIATPVQNSISPFVDSLPEAIKFTRYRSPVIPTRQGMQLWCIDQIDRMNFFAIMSDGCLHMQGREHVPDYTVVRMINSRIDLERLEDLVRNCSPGKSHRKMTDDCRLELNRLAHDYSGKLPRGWQQAQSIISGLRTDFELERAGLRESLGSRDELESMALSRFLTNRRGPDYLFATTAALMLDHLGYHTRFVAGFYANPEHYVASEGEISILPSDVHTWLEIDVGHGYWIPLEPCPGYLAPRYSAGIWYHIKHHRWAIAIWALALSAIAVCTFLLRRLLVELFSWLALPVVRLLNDQRRIAWLTWLLDIRCRMAGVPRARGTILREHLNRYRTSLPTELGQQVGLYLESADRMWFGGMSKLSMNDQVAIAGVWRGLTIRTLKRVNKLMTAGTLV